MAAPANDDLGLSLSLTFRAEISTASAAAHTSAAAAAAHPNLRSMQLSLTPCSNQPSDSAFRQAPFSILHKTHFTGAFVSSDRASADVRPFLRGFDVNRLPATTECDEEAVVSSPNSAISSVSGKRCEREANCDDQDHDMERASSRGISDEEDGDNCRKKLRLSKDQSALLEETFKDHNTLNPKQKQALAKRLNLRPRQVEVWFQNRRARTKLKQTEVDCEFLKRCCDNLTDENRRLQKEVQELRALKHSPQFYMHMTPPTTLTMCPNCERVAVPPSSSGHRTISAPQRCPAPIKPWPFSGNAVHLRS